MKLELEQKLIAEDCLQELGFNTYIQKLSWKNSIPICAAKILSPLKSAAEGKEHYEQLQLLEQHLKEQSQKELEESSTENYFKKDLDISLLDLLEKLLNASELLPDITSVLLSIENGSLEQYHLTLMGKFLETANYLEKLEDNIYLESTIKAKMQQVFSILSNYMIDNFQKLSLNEFQKQILDHLQEFEKDLQKILSTYENEILKLTKIKMVYPYPKELSLSSEELERVKDSQLLKIKIKGELYQLDYILPPNIQAIISKKQETWKEFQLQIDQKLKKIASELAPFILDLNHYLEVREKLTWQYLLIYGKNKYHLNWPIFTLSGENSGQDEQKAAELVIINGVLEELRQQCEINLEKNDYVPLNLELKEGVGVIFGANMSGKTSVLKSVYFLLWLCKLGLPVPANYMRLTFPNQIYLHLKSSGSIRNNTSTFSEEIKFFCRPFSHGSYVMVDELFLSTNPISGVELSKIFLSEFAKHATSNPPDVNNENKTDNTTVPTIFLCTTQYPEVLQLKEISLFRMPDYGYQLQKVDSLELAKNSWAINDCLKPLQLALEYPLPKSIKARIKEQLP